jgi:hypothetical protein
VPASCHTAGDVREVDWASHQSIGKMKTARYPKMASR